MRGAKIYVLEAVKFTDDHLRENVLGYMRAHFRTKKDACSYYDKHMRSLNAFDTVDERNDSF